MCGVRCESFGTTWQSNWRRLQTVLRWTFAQKKQTTYSSVLHSHTVLMKVCPCARYRQLNLVLYPNNHILKSTSTMTCWDFEQRVSWFYVWGIYHSAKQAGLITDSSPGFSRDQNHTTIDWVIALGLFKLQY